MQAAGYLGAHKLRLPKGPLRAEELAMNFCFEPVRVICRLRMKDGNQSRSHVLAFLSHARASHVCSRRLSHHLL